MSLVRSASLVDISRHMLSMQVNKIEVPAHYKIKASLPIRFNCATSVVNWSTFVDISHRCASYGRIWSVSLRLQRTVWSVATTYTLDYACAVIIDTHIEASKRSEDYTIEDIMTPDDFSHPSMSFASRELLFASFTAAAANTLEFDGCCVANHASLTRFAARSMCRHKWWLTPLSLWKQNIFISQVRSDSTSVSNMVIAVSENRI